MAEPAVCKFSGRDAFRQRVRDALAAAAHDGVRELILSDANFGDWPLGERTVAQSLQQWAASGRRCILLARTYDHVVRVHARFVTWRTMWSHVVEARACPSADPLELPSAVWTPAWMLHRLDPERSSCVFSDEPQRRLLLREQLAEWLSRSTPAFPAVTLGL